MVLPVPIPTNLIKPIVEALIDLIRKGKKKLDEPKAKKAIKEVILDLYLMDPDISAAEAEIQIQRAAGRITPDLLRAEEYVQKIKAHKSSAKKAAKKSPAKKTAKKASAKKAAKKAPAKKA